VNKSSFIWEFLCADTQNIQAQKVGEKQTDVKGVNTAGCICDICCHQNANLLIMSSSDI